VFPTWIPFFKRLPRAGSGKDFVMTPPTPSPGSSLPGTAPAPVPTPAPADVTRQIADLTDAVNRLVQAQQQSSSSAPPRPSAPGPDIGGAIPGGEPIVLAVDHAKLTPLQQITLGLRGVTPVGTAGAALAKSKRDARRLATDDEDDDAPTGAD
jgi:hypothetical protein